LKLTDCQRTILQWMVDHRDDGEGELVRSVPGGWWVSTQKVTGPTAFFFLRHCLIRRCSFSDKSLEIYYSTEYTKKALQDPTFSIFQEMHNSMQPD
jgi:hypothetical protein